jgi:hypothetical protein
VGRAFSQTPRAVRSGSPRYWFHSALAEDGNNPKTSKAITTRWIIAFVPSIRSDTAAKCLTPDCPTPAEVVLRGLLPKPFFPYFPDSALCLRQDQQVT